MNIKKLEEMRYRILSDVEKEFTDELIPAKLSEKDESDVPVLNVMMTGSDEEMGNASGEFFFLPPSQGDEIQYFINLITLFEKIPEENLDEVCVAISGINTYVTCGAFAVDFAAGSLIYKYVSPMSSDALEDHVRENVDLSMGCAFQAVSEFGYLMTEVCEGVRSAQSAIEVITGEV